MSTEELRRRNTAAVLRLLREDGSLSRAELARRSGLAKATVGTIVGALHEAGAVREGSSTPSARGRPSRLVELDGAHLIGLGVEVNVDYVAVTALDLAGREVVATEEAITAPTPQDVVDLVVETSALLDDEERTLLGVTVALPGLVDHARGVVVDAPNLGWRDLALGDLVERGLRSEDRAPRNPPVAIDNDANCAARAEAARGVAVGVADFVYLTGTIGLGAGILSNGQILRGARGVAGEVGHLRVGTDEVCGCGRHGCWEALAGLRALAEATGVRRRLDEDPVAYAERVATLHARPRVHDGLARIGAALARGCAQLSATLDPACVVLGGSFVPLGQWLVPPIEEALDDGFAGPGVRVELSTLGLHAASVGAAVGSLDVAYAGVGLLQARGTDKT